jgi:hypothetical protein
MAENVAAAAAADVVAEVEGEANTLIIDLNTIQLYTILLSIKIWDTR